MQLHLDDNRPIFLQIAAWLEDGIISGELAEEAQIPSITDFSIEYKINPATALKGVNMLVDADLLYKKRGVGMFVSAGARQKLLERRRRDFFRDFILPLLGEAQAVGLSAAQIISMIERGSE